MKKRSPLSLPEVGYSIRFGNVVKRLFRAGWVLAANGCIAWLMVARLRSVGWLPALDFQWMEEAADEQ